MFRKRSFLVIILLIFIKPAVGQISEAEVKKILINLPHISIDSVKRDSLQSRLFQEDEDVILSIFKRIISSKDLPRGFSYDRLVTLEAIKVTAEMNSEQGWNLLIQFVKKWSSEPYSEDYWIAGRLREAFFLGQTCRVLAKSPPHVLKKINGLVQTDMDDNTRKWLQIIIGFAGQDTYYNEIMKLLETDPDPYIREYAALALREIGRKECIGLLEKALKDTFYVEITYKTSPGDVRAPVGKDYLVRKAAAKALRRLGVKVDRKGLEFWIQE